MLLTKKSVYRHIIRPLQKKGYKIRLVGSISKKGYSNKDIDILLTLPDNYICGDKIFVSFEKDLKKLNWLWFCDDETPEYGIFHNYCKGEIGLDVFVEEIIF